MQEALQTYYVYRLIDPRKKQPFYVGKGRGNRAQTHLWNLSRAHNKYKDNVIAAIRAEGLEPLIEYAYENIVSESEAYDLEAAEIKRLGRKGYEEGGILTNVCQDGRPPSHKGRTYEEIYGPERAKEQIEKRRALQLARGGYGPKVFTEGTLKKMGESSKRTKNYLKVTAEGRARVAEKARLRKGSLNVRSERYVLVSPQSVIHTLHGWTEVKAFCAANNLSYGTFHSNLQKGWPPSKRGKNLGWRITRVDRPKD